MSEKEFFVHDSLDNEGEILEILWEGGVECNEPQLSQKSFFVGEELGPDCIGSSFDLGMEGLGELEVL